MSRILELLAEGRLVRGTWASTDSQGRKLLCLLTALTGDPGTRPESCPADLAPAWVAHLMPWWDDSGSAERWPDLMRQVGELAPRFGALYGATGRRALAGCQLVGLRVALRHAGDAAPAVERVITLWERVLRGDEPADDEWRAVREEAAAAEAAAWPAAAAAAARAAARAAVWAAVWASAEAAAAAEAAAWPAAAAAAGAADWAAAAATAKAAAGWADWIAAAQTTADEIIQGHIDAIREALA